MSSRGASSARHPARTPGGAGQAEEDPIPLRVVFVIRHLGYVRHFDSVIRGLLERGHHVLLRYERDRWTDRELAWLHELGRDPSFEAAFFDGARRDRWYRFGAQLRRVCDYVYYLGPAFRRLPSLVGKAESRVGPRYAALVRPPSLRSERLRNALWRALDTIERAIPVSRTLEAELRAVRPDVLVLVPHLMPGIRHSEWVRAARRVGVPTCVCIASWDNLTTKTLLRAVPERLLVWNDFQRREAEELHGVPQDRIVVTGAQSFDEWFAWTPRSREEFCRRVGLDPARPYVLYLGSALFRAEIGESAFVSEHWLPELRRDPRFADTNVLVRPHPRRIGEWETSRFDELDGVVVWPVQGAAMPVDEESRADFFDSIYHATAVAGINTTAMIEAAIIGRSVHTVVVPELLESQALTHFDYMVEVGGGILDVATSWEDHRDSLAGALAGEDASANRRRAFIEAFIRPRGVDEPALGHALDAIEETAHAPLLAEPEGAGVLVLRSLLVASRLVAVALRRTARRARRRFGRAPRGEREAGAT